MSVETLVYGEAVRVAHMLRSKRRRFWLGEKMAYPDDQEDSRAGKSGSNRSYTVSCSSGFRDEVLALAQRRGVNTGNLARAVMLLVPPEAIGEHPDPGEPEVWDRETVTLKSGVSAGKVWRRKPRLQVRAEAGLEIADIRRALALALAMDGGEVALMLEQGDLPSASKRLDKAAAEINRLRKQVRALLFEPLEHHVRSRTDALYVLGFAPGARPGVQEIRKRYRSLAAVHHPDSSHGEHLRMSQLNEAVRILRGKT